MVVDAERGIVGCPNRKSCNLTNTILQKPKTDKKVMFIRERHECSFPSVL